MREGKGESERGERRESVCEREERRGESVCEREESERVSERVRVCVRERGEERREIQGEGE